MLEAAGWAALAASTLVIGAWLGTVQRGVPPPRRVGDGLRGRGVDRVRGLRAHGGGLRRGGWRSAGRRSRDRSPDLLPGGSLRRPDGRIGGKSAAASPQGNANALLLGAALDGIPESLIIGLSLIGGGSVEVAFLVSVAVSNVPEGFASAAQQHEAGVPTRRILRRWVFIVAISALCGAIGFALFDELDPGWVAFTQSFAAGALLTMVMDTMVPEAFRDAGPVTGLVAVAGFWLAFWLGTL